jgi:hypothetical protein
MINYYGLLQAFKKHLSIIGKIDEVHACDLAE